jgi:hypothetical protein
MTIMNVSLALRMGQLVKILIVVNSKMMELVAYVHTDRSLINMEYVFPSPISV